MPQNEGLVLAQGGSWGRAGAGYFINVTVSSEVQHRRM